MTILRRYMLRAALATIVVLLPGSLSAHVLDEYLQATRISVEIDRIAIEMDLTPGAEVANNVFQTIDLNHNGTVSSAEAAAYANYVVSSLSLNVDGKRRIVKLEEYHLPELDEMRRGEGVIRLRVISISEPAAAGQHRLAFSNTLRSDISEYLVNALVPEDKRIRINGQERNPSQSEFALDYTVFGSGEGTRSRAALPVLVVLAVVSAFAIAKHFKSRMNIG